MVRMGGVSSRPAYPELIDGNPTGEGNMAMPDTGTWKAWLYFK